MKIFNSQVYGLNESIFASGYPMKTEVGDMLVRPSEFENDIKRSKSLGKAKTGSGHDCFLKGIIVQFDLKAPEYFWRQFDRYHFHDYISSQSKMHCITKMNIVDMCNEYVDQRVIDVVNEKITEYNSNPSQENFQRVISNCPMGFELTARITSNYLQEKSIRNQRNNHKLEEWNYYRNWQTTLPSFIELTERVTE